MHERHVQTVHAETLEAVFDRATNAVGRIVEYDVVRGIGQRIDLRMLVVLRSLEQLSDLGRQQIVFALLAVQKVTEAVLRKSEPIPGRHVEIPNADRPRGFEGRFGVLSVCLLNSLPRDTPPSPKRNSGL